MKKIDSTEHQYNISIGFFVAILVAGILKFLDISKSSYLGEKILFIDWIILIFLGIIAFLESLLIKNLFVMKDKIIISKKTKVIDCLIKVLAIIIIIAFIIFTKIL